MKPSEIQELIKFVAKSGVSEVEIENKDFKITIKTPPHKKGKQVVEAQPVIQVQSPAAAPVSTVVSTPEVSPAKVNVASEPPVEVSEGDNEDSNYVTVKSPMIGTFYRKPSPDKPAFVNVGDDINNDTVVCTIEAMKLFNEIEAEMSGKVVKVLVDDGSPVEYDQPLFLVDPS